MPVIDTSFLIAAWNKDHAFHARSHELLQQATANQQPLAVNAGALSEASRIIRRLAKDQGAKGNEIARSFLHAFLHLPGATIADRHADIAWSRYLAQNPLSFVDAWVREQADQTGQSVWSFDKQISDVPDL